MPDRQLVAAPASSESLVPGAQQLSMPMTIDTMAEMVIAHQKTPKELATLITTEAYKGLEAHCRIPERYHHCTLGLERIDVRNLSDSAIRV